MSLIVNNTTGEVIVDQGPGASLVGAPAIGYARLTKRLASAPTADSDVTDGYVVGSHWIDTATGSHYFCSDNTAGAAVWDEMTDTGGGSGDLTVNGTIIGYKDNATSLRVKGPSSPNDPSAGADVQSYSGIFYNDAYSQTGTLKTRVIHGANLEMDLEIQGPHQVRIAAVDDTQADGQIYAASKTNVVFNARANTEVASPKQLIVDRVDTGTTGPANTSNVELSVSSGELEIASPVTVTGSAVILPADTTIGDVSNTEIAVLDGLTATTAELNKSDQTAETETIDSGVAASAALRITLIDNTVGGAGAITLAAPDASMVGLPKVIEMTVDGGDVTLATTNIVGSGGTTITFDAPGDNAAVIGGVASWIYAGGSAVVS
jgi:hypothetical protein